MYTLRFQKLLAFLNTVFHCWLSGAKYSKTFQETPYSDDMEDEEASFSQTTTAEPSPSLADQGKNSF